MPVATCLSLKVCDPHHAIRRDSDRPMPESGRSPHGRFRPNRHVPRLSVFQSSTRLLQRPPARRSGQQGDEREGENGEPTHQFDTSQRL